MERRCRAGLSLGKTIDPVIHHDIRDVHISSACVGKMSGSDGKAVPIATRTDHGQCRVGQLGSLGNGQEPSMDGIEPVGFNIPWNPGGTTDPRDQGNILGVNSYFRQGMVEGVQDSKISASWTPDGIETGFII